MTVKNPYEPPTYGVVSKAIERRKAGKPPASEAGEPEDDEDKQSQAGQTPGLPAQESLKAVRSFVQRQRNCYPRTHIGPRDPIRMQCAKSALRQMGWEPIGGRLRLH